MHDSLGAQPFGTVEERDACGVGFVADVHGHAGRAVVEAGLAGLAGVRHRGAVAADGASSDGCGLLTPLPDDRYGPPGTVVAMLFGPAADPTDALATLADAVDLRLLEVVAPSVDPTVLGDQARSTLPPLRRAVLAPVRALADQLADGDDEPIERAAWLLRRRLRATTGAYAASCSARTVVHKGLVRADRLAEFWLDLADDTFSASFAVFHQRYSTNTAPTWERAQPMRSLCHNGEINTITGNVRRLAARRLGTEAVGLGPEADLLPIVDPDGSDSAHLDEVLELLVRGGRDVAHAMAMLVPPAWEGDHELPAAVRGAYAYHAALMEPWDGPAAVVFTDGRVVGAALDRNGLRPLRVTQCEDGLIVCASEAGAVPLQGRGTRTQTRLGPGDRLVVEPGVGVRTTAELHRILVQSAPYASWAADGLRPADAGDPIDQVGPDLAARQVAHGCTREEVAMVLRPMAVDAAEPSFAMGDDAPLPHLARRPRPIAHFVRQRFAQVTNPPIDPLRERRVMSLRTLLGPRAPLLGDDPRAARLIELSSVLLFPDGVDALRTPSRSPFATATLELHFPIAAGALGLAERLDALGTAAVAAVADGAGIVVLDHTGVDADHAPVPSLLALGAVHQDLVRAGRRADTSIVVVADDARDTHAVAALVAFGADAVCPRLAFETVAELADGDDSSEVAAPEAQERLRSALEGGVRKILSKLGICTIDGYRDARAFEVLGLGHDVVARCLDGAPSVVGGLDLSQVGAMVLGQHAAAWPADGADPTLASPGWVRVRIGGDPHANDKRVVSALNELTATTPPARGDEPPSPAARATAAAHLLQRAIAGDDDDLYRRFARLVDERTPLGLVDQLEVVASGAPVPVDEVEPAEAIVRRFSTGAMSHGALSKEAHETLAAAMNLLGGRSNCGEGGEDPARYRTRGRGRDDTNSSIKQVASGRFGVTPEYLAFADEIQIKMAQGSKPGEGGQLPGHKVTREIAALRHTQPGVGLISPPPHHDIYSIEDLAQLVYDLKQVNAAEVSVKLVAGAGVGTVAVGCVKALADTVHISGANGGTGASPLSSIKHAGMPWELGLADAQQALVTAGLRDRVVLRVDGGFATGRQILTAALLGADEFSFGTAAMIAEGCIMLRACHRDTCTPGVATQRPHLRANFLGTPEGVAAYLMFVAHDVRRRLAAVGARSLGEVVGQVELLRQRAVGDPAADSVDLGPLLRRPTPADAPRRFVAHDPIQSPRDDLGDRLLADAFRAIWDGDQITVPHAVTNKDRSLGAALAGALALEFGAEEPPGRATIELTGSAGQSLGAFGGPGVHMVLTGVANDYVGKGLAGGSIAIRPDAATVTDPAPVLAGNTCLYGATGGRLFVAGAVGERFAVRNSGADAVVEAAGDHCCEYMTGGTVVVLGEFGPNLGAGMTGGEVFIWDGDAARLAGRVNGDLVAPIRPDRDALDLARWLVEEHVAVTGSPRGAGLLAAWDERLGDLWQVVPRDEADRLAASAAARVGVA